MTAELDGLIEPRRVRGRHIELARRALDDGTGIPDVVVTTVPPSGRPPKP